MSVTNATPVAQFIQDPQGAGRMNEIEMVNLKIYDHKNCICQA